MEMTVQIEGDSEEAVAFALLQMVAQAEGKLAADGALTGVDREWILDTYAECRMAIKGVRPFDMEDEDEEEDEDEADEHEGESAPAR